MFLVNEPAATREMNVQLTKGMSQLKTSVTLIELWEDVVVHVLIEK
jgi:hypothetical protein